MPSDFQVLGAPHHACLAVTSIEASRRFWVETLGFPPAPGVEGLYLISPEFEVADCPMLPEFAIEATGWSSPAAGLPVHANTWAQINNHISLPVDNLPAVAARLLAGGYETFQMDEVGNRVDIGDPNTLSFGLGSVFAYDSSGNLIEFGEPNRGTWEHIGGNGPFKARPVPLVTRLFRYFRK